MKKILRNAVRCKKCGDIIESKTSHDFQTCTCGNVSVDGGHLYLRRCFKQGGIGEDYDELSEYEEEEE